MHQATPQHARSDLQAQTFVWHEACVSAQVPGRGQPVFLPPASPLPATAGNTREAVFLHFIGQTFARQSSARQETQHA